MLRLLIAATLTCLCTAAFAEGPACNGRSDILSLTRCFAGSTGILDYTAPPKGMCSRREVPTEELLEPVPLV